MLALATVVRDASLIGWVYGGVQQKSTMHVLFDNPEKGDVALRKLAGWSLHWLNQLNDGGLPKWTVGQVYSGPTSG